MQHLSFAKSINKALFEAMGQDNSVICYGLGINDPKAIFGTTKGLKDRFGSNRVFDTPTSENAMTGIGIGASLTGIKPVMTHQRLDFFLLAMDQLVNSAAKWHYMFGSQISVPITIRLIIGRGWGQGPTHSQNLQSWFAHIPGLKVVCPTTPSDARDLLFESIFDPDPVVFLEHRWLHSSIGEVNEKRNKDQIGKAKIVNHGKDITIVASSYMVVEAIRAKRGLDKVGVSSEIIDLRSYNPIDWRTIKRSVAKTGRLIVVDSGFSTCSIASEIIATISCENFSDLKAAPIKLAMPDCPEPTSFGLTKDFYLDSYKIESEALKLLNVNEKIERIGKLKTEPHDIPGDWFKGPF